MNFARKIAILVLTFVFGVLLVAVPAVTTFNRTIGSQNNIKHWLKDSGLYSNTVNALIEEGTKAAQNQANQSIPTAILDTPQFKTAAQQAFTPQFLQSATETAIDGIFSWMQGKTPTPQFTVNVQQVKQRFANNLNQAAKERYAALPPCTIKQIPMANIDPLSITCRVPGYDVGPAIDQATNNILNDQSFLPDNTITANSLQVKADSQTKPVYQQFAYLPLLYRVSQVGLRVLLALTLAAALGLIFLYPDKRQGIRRVATKLIVVGGVILILTFGLGFAFSAINQSIQPHGSTATAALQQSGLYIAQQAEKAAEQISYWFGGSYVILGILLLLTDQFLFKPRSHPEPATQNIAPETNTPIQN